MFTIRFHGRGGQGMKTASRLLGRAFFMAGYEVQDAPVYGAERRGAPITAYVRADREPILQRGIIRHPGLVVVADDSLIPLPAAGVLNGIGATTVLLAVSLLNTATWRERLRLAGPILILPPLQESGYGKTALLSAACAGAAAALTGVIGQEHLLRAIGAELAALSDATVATNCRIAEHAFLAMAQHQGIMPQTQDASPDAYRQPAWLDLPLETAPLSAPAISGTQTSVLVKTGLWRTQRPVIDYQRCHRCWWVCSSFCPDSAINVRADGTPEIDYEHCKGCMICVAQCPSHALETQPEIQAQQEAG
ncbi:MAG: 2-oxoacid:acceptor oxidoreductase family protein [Gammaproteobacteria bacterium]